MTHIAAGRTDHISQTRSDEFPIKLTSRKDGSVEFCTLAYAIERLSGYYRLEDDDTEADVAEWIERRLGEGKQLSTMSFIYQKEG